MALDEVIFPMHLLFLLWRDDVLLLRVGTTVECVEDDQLDSFLHHRPGLDAVRHSCVVAVGAAQRRRCQGVSCCGRRGQHHHDGLLRYSHVEGVALDASCTRCELFQS